MAVLDSIIYPQEFSFLSEIVQAIHDKKYDQAKEYLLRAEKDFFHGTPYLEGPGPSHIQTQLFLQGLYKRLLKNYDAEQNLYLQDKSQQIHLFNFMATHFPVVSHAQSIVNTAITENIRQQESITILDIGIGTAQQISALLKQLHHAGKLPGRIQIIGIEPSIESLNLAEEKLTEVLSSYKVDFMFKSFVKPVEHFTTRDWQSIKKVAKTTEALFINASFALHHVRPVAIRNDIFKEIQALAPQLLTIIEPYSDHVTRDLTQRFKNAWTHYGLTFKAIDCVKAPLKDKQAVKEVFFGSEIKDVLAPDPKRVEQFETAAMWLDRLTANKFQPIDLKEYSTPISFNPIVRLQHFGHYSAITVDGEPIISIIGVTP